MWGEKLSINGEVFVRNVNTQRQHPSTDRQQMSTGDEILENECRKIAQATYLLFIDQASRESRSEFETVDRSSISRPVSEVT